MYRISQMTYYMNGVTTVISQLANEIRIRNKRGKICMKEWTDGEMNRSFARAIRNKGKILFWSFCG